MVRIMMMQQGLSPLCRSRHTSGELIDQNLAQRAVEALALVPDSSPTQRPRLDSESTHTSEGNESFFSDFSDHDGAFQSQEEKCETETLDEDKLEKRKQRRRERNKVSAQAYRQRKRQSGNAQEKILEELAAQQRILLDKIQHLETEKHVVENFLRNRCHGNCNNWPWQAPGAIAVWVTPTGQPCMMTPSDITTTGTPAPGTTDGTPVTTPVTEMETEGAS